jgi:hypothetical protein
MAKTTTVTITCDQCGRVIDVTDRVVASYQKPSVAFEGDDGLTFNDWSDEAANVPGAMHLHSDSCASSHLLEWLRSQRVSKDEAAPAPVVVDAAPVVEVPSDGSLDDGFPF